MFAKASGFFRILLTMASPVMAQITTVSQKGPVMAIRLKSVAVPDSAVAADMGMEPSPASLVKSPREIPMRSPVSTAVPISPPARAREENALRTITVTASHRKPRFKNSSHRHPVR